MKKALVLLLFLVLLLCCAPFAAGAEAVEDVPVLGAVSAAAVEPVTAERVAPAAELQAITDKHVAKIVDLATGAETGYTSLMGAYQAAGARETLCEVVLLKDVTIVPKANSYGEQFPGAAISGMANDPECYLTCNLVNSSDPEITVNGFWLNLNGHTVTVNCTDYYQPCFYANSSIPVNIKNGAIYYKYNRSSQMLAFGIIACGYGSSESNYSEIGTETELFSPTITLKDATLIRVGTYRGPVICVKTLSSDIRLIRSTLFATKYSALLYSKNSYATTMPEDIRSVRHNLTLTDCRIGSADASNGAIIATSVQRGRIMESSTLNVTAQGVNHFIGSEPVTVDAEGPTFNFSAPGEAADDTTVIAVPAVDSCATATTNDAVPEYPAPAAYAAKRYGEPPHNHTTEHHEAVPATFLADGSIEYWYCTECEQYFSDSAYTNRIAAEETVLARLVDAAGMQDAEMVALGAVAKAVAPDGGVKAYSDLNAAYREGATWTTAGGVVQMLCDYTHVDAVKAAAVGVVNNGAESRSNNQSWRYRNADEPTIDGFWFDLGGHTLAVRSGRPVFYAMESIPVNVRNGRIVYQNTAGTASSYAPLKSGYTTSRSYTSTTVYCPEWTLDHVTFVRVPRASKSDFGAEGTPTTGPVFYVSTLQSRINIIDSTVICDDGSNAILYSKATPSANAARRSRSGWRDRAVSRREPSTFAMSTFAIDEVAEELVI